MKTTEAINDEILRRNKLTERYEMVKADFEKINNVSIFMSGLQPIVVDYTTLKLLIRDEAKRRILMIGPDNNHKTDTAVTRILLDFVEACENSISESFRKSLSIDVKERELFLECKDRIAVIKDTVTDCGSTPPPIDITLLPIEGIPSISLLDGIDLKLLVPRKPMISVVVTQFGGHSASEIVTCINKAAASLAGAEPDDTNKIEGYIEKEGGAVRPILDQINHLVRESAQKYEKICADYWSKCQDTVLGEIIPDKAVFDVEIEHLRNLKDELLKIQEQI